MHICSTVQHVAPHIAQEYNILLNSTTYRKENWRTEPCGWQCGTVTALAAMTSWGKWSSLWTCIALMTPPRGPTRCSQGSVKYHSWLDFYTKQPVKPPLLHNKSDHLSQSFWVQLFRPPVLFSYLPASHNRSNYILFSAPPPPFQKKKKKTHTYTNTHYQGLVRRIGDQQ